MAITPGVHNRRPKPARKVGEKNQLVAFLHNDLAVDWAVDWAVIAEARSLSCVGMDLELCPVCAKALDGDSYSQWCSRRCKDMALRKRLTHEAFDALALPVATVPPDIAAQLPQGAEHEWACFRFLLVSRAPAGARGYRLGTMRARARSMRYFPPSAHRCPAMFALEPFERPLLPRRGLYVVLYCDERGQLIGTPRFTIEVNHRERYLRFTDGDRAAKPRRPVVRRQG